MPAKPYMQERWFTLLEQAIAEDPRGKAGVVDRLLAAGATRISRPQIALVVSGKYPAATDRLAAKVLAAFDRHHCPYLGAEVQIEHCITINRGPVPTWDPAALDNRRVCQTCPNKPATEGGHK